MPSNEPLDCGKKTSLKRPQKEDSAVATAVRETLKNDTILSVSSPLALPTKSKGVSEISRNVPAVNATGSRRFASLGTFVEGMSNRLAKTTADIAVLHPGKMNPIYIHGGTSVGKTHLLEGIWSETKKRKDRKPPLFMTAEQFTTAFIESLRQGTPGFRNKFRGISALLIDDIQFFLGKTSTQTELLRTIDTLKNQGVQLVFSGDRPLKELRGLRTELLSRLEAGMVCGIEPAERDTLLRIFEQMVKQRNLPLSPEVCRFVASRLNAHARQLSGALNRLHAASLAEEKPITVQAAEKILDDLIRNNRKSVRLTDIDQIVCETFGLGQQSLQSKSRSEQVAHPRMLAMWLARKYTRSALSEIGKYFGNRAHSTVVSAQKKVDHWLDEDFELPCLDQNCPVSDVIQKLERVLQAG